MRKNKRLLLISNTYAHGNVFLEHVKEEIEDFIKGIDSILFIPYALADRDKYTKLAQAYFKKINKNLESVHTSNDPKKAVQKAQAIFVGGGNTFRLLKELYEADLVDILKSRLKEGIPYIGSSAGANIASPAIKTTNDMPIVQTPTLNALGMISFQINSHYIDHDPNSKHKGESRELRIHQFHEENTATVVGLREGAWLRIEGSRIRLGGMNGAKVFKKGEAPKDYKSGINLRLQ